MHVACHVGGKSLKVCDLVTYHWVLRLAFLSPYYVGNTYVNECKPQELFTIEIQRTSLLIISLPMNIQFFFVALRTNAGHGVLALEVARSHTMLHHSR